MFLTSLPWSRSIPIGMRKKRWRRISKATECLDALSDYGFYEQGLVQQPVCGLNHIAPFLKARAEGKGPEKLWGYYCVGQPEKVTNRFIVQPGYRTRVLGAQMYKYELAGFLQWGYNFYNSAFSLHPIDPYRCTDADGAFPSGDPFIVYPGKDGAPEESQRLHVMDEAMSDLCAMNLLEGLCGREAVLACLEARWRGNSHHRGVPQKPGVSHGSPGESQSEDCGKYVSSDGSGSVPELFLEKLKWKCGLLLCCIISVPCFSMSYKQILF